MPSPEQNLACDEVLLDIAESDGGPDVLRFWESPTYFVVLGYSNPFESAVRADVAERHGIPVLRRKSGGGTVLQGPGCLNYALVLRELDGEPLPGLTCTNRRIMQRNALAIARLTGLDVRVEGVTDLAIDGRKFSGNASRRRRRAVLFHGSLLLRFDVDAIERVLRPPERQPIYRESRSHADFVRNLPADAADVKRALAAAWGAHELMDDVPRARVHELARTLYGLNEWTHRF